MKKLITRRSKGKFPTDYCDSGQNNLDLPLDVNGDSANTSVIKNIKLTGVLLSLFSICSYVFDFGSDIYLMITYYRQNYFIWFLLTLIFVFLPSFTMTLFSVFWYWSDKKPRFSYVGWVIRLFFHFIQMAPLVRYIDTLIYAWKSKYAKTEKEKLRYYQLMIFEEADSALLRVMECSMESTPQLLLQLYILLTQPYVKEQTVIVIQIVSSFLSLVSLAWCLTAYQSSLRLVTPGKEEMEVSSMVIMVFWKFLVIFPKFLSIALFTSIYKLYILIVLGFHYMVMAIYIIAQGTTFFSPRKFTFREIMFNLVMAAIYCVDYLNLKEGVTRYRYTFYYGICFCEIVTLIIFWYFNPILKPNLLSLRKNISFLYSGDFATETDNFYYQMWSVPIRKLVLLETITCYIIGIILMEVYFLRFHPTQNIKLFYKRKKPKAIICGDTSIVHQDNIPTTSITKTTSEEITLIVSNN